MEETTALRKPPQHIPLLLVKLQLAIRDTELHIFDVKSQSNNERFEFCIDTILKNGY